ncbi:MAG: gliding motility-associated C-terminal domain-containing protein [Cyclobacteriaceae bacterium]
MSKKFAICIGLLFCVSIVQAQYVSRLGRFQVDEIKGCAPFTVNLTNLLAGECTPGKPCQMNYEGSGEVQNLFSFTYTTPGVYTLSVLYQSIGADDITVTVDENIVPDFEIYSCANADVTINVTNKDYDQFVIDFTNDGIPETIIPSGNNATAFHNYATTGGKVINVRGRNLNSADNCDSNVQNFTALNILPAPTIDMLTTVDATTIALELSLQEHIQYRLEIAVNNSSTFQLFKTIYDEPTVTVPNLKTNDNYYCFRLSAFDFCNNTNNYSPIVCSQKFTLSVASGVNNLSWQTSYQNVQSVEVKRDETTTNIFQNSPFPFTFADQDITCKVTYCYQLISNYPGGAKSISLQKCGTAFRTSTPPAISNAAAVVGSPGVTLEWIQEPPAMPTSYSILRSVDGQTFRAINSANTTSFEDPEYDTDTDFYYRIDYIDECDNLSPAGKVIHPIKLVGSLNDNNAIALSWNEYKGFEAGVDRYVVEKFNQSGTRIQTNNVGNSLSFVDDEPDPNNQVVTYVVTAIATQNGLPVSISNKITLTKDINLFFPTAFSPNGDNLNDVFIVKGQFIVEMEFSIFNRWGELIYNNNTGEPWNGTIGGKPVHEDAYIWSAQITDLAGRTFKESGTVAVVRPAK